MKYSKCRITLVLAATILLVATKLDDAFVPSLIGAHHSPSRMPSSPFSQKTLLTQEHVPTALTRQRRSVASVQTMSLFGLGLPEIALIAVAAFFLLGPQKVGELVKDSGKAAGELADELKNVPTEFQKGMEEGETEARSRKAKKIKPLKKEEDE